MTRVSAGVYTITYTVNAATDSAGYGNFAFAWSVNSVAMTDGAIAEIQSAEQIATLANIYSQMATSSQANTIITTLGTPMQAGNVTVGGYAADQDPGSYLTAQGYTTARAGYLDTLNGLVGNVWNALLSGMTTVGSIGAKLAAWVIGSPLQSTDSRLPATTIAAQTDVSTATSTITTAIGNVTNASNYTGSFSALVMANAPVATLPSNITLLPSGKLQPGSFTVYQYGSFAMPDGSPIALAFYNKAGNPQALTGLAVEFAVYTKTDAGLIPQWSWVAGTDAAATVGGASNNELLLLDGNAHTQKSGTFRYVVRAPLNTQAPTAPVTIGFGTFAVEGMPALP